MSAVIGNNHDPNTSARLANAIEGHTYAVLAVRDKLDEVCQLLRWKFSQEGE